MYIWKTGNRQQKLVIIFMLNFDAFAFFREFVAFFLQVVPFLCHNQVPKVQDTMAKLVHSFC